MPARKCEICNAPAVYHETKIEQGAVFQHHFCENHGDRVWLDALPTFDDEESIEDFKTMLVDEIDRDPELFETDLNQDEVKRRIENATSLEDLFAMLRRR